MVAIRCLLRFIDLPFVRETLKTNTYRTFYDALGITAVKRTTTEKMSPTMSVLTTRRP